MKKPKLRDIMFCCILLFCAAICCISLVVLSDSNTEYVKNRADAYLKKTDKKTNVIDFGIDDELTKEMHVDDIVYITERGGSYHVDKSCAGKSENLLQVTLSEAVEQEKTPCSRCLKDYVLILYAK